MDNFNPFVQYNPGGLDPGQVHAGVKAFAILTTPFSPYTALIPAGEENLPKGQNLNFFWSYTTRNVVAFMTATSHIYLSETTLVIGKVG